MTQSTTGLILRTRPLTETSLIVNWLTPDCGRVSTVAKGARRPKSPFRGKLDLFYLADFSFQRSRRSDLHQLREVNLRDTNRMLRQDLASLEQAAYCAALLEQSTETETPLPALFELMGSLLDQLAQRPPQLQTRFAFELKLLKELGQSPDLLKAKLTLGSRRILAELTDKDWPALARLRLSEPQIRELNQFLHGFLIYHLGKIPGRRGAVTGG